MGNPCNPPHLQSSGLSCTSRGAGSGTDIPPTVEYMRQMSDAHKHFLHCTFMDNPNESAGDDQAGYTGHDHNGGGGDNGSCRESCGERCHHHHRRRRCRLSPTSSFRWIDSRYIGGSWEENGRCSCCFALGYHTFVLTSVSNHRGRVSRFLLPMELDTVFGSGASLLNHSQTQILLCNELTGLFLAANL